MPLLSALRRSNRTTSSAAERNPARTGRWIGALVVAMVLHGIAAVWVQHNRNGFKTNETTHVPVQVSLLTPERIERKPTAPAAPAASPKPAAAGHPPREHVLTATHSGASKLAAASAVPATAASDGAANASASAATAGAGAANGVATNAAQATPGVKFAVPPSGELSYDTFYNGVRNAPGTIHWRSDGQSYEMVVSMPLPFVGTFSYSSHGRVDAFGLAPDQYIEKRGRRGEDVTIFNRSTKQIGFTRTPTTLPLPDGAQDRFSMVMQLASLVRGDPAAYKPGVTRQFFVADNDSGEIWPIETIGDEDIRTDQGYVNARHFMRLPRHDGDRRRIDVWLAPSLGWLPVRIMQTEPNGTQIQLVWKGPLNVPGASPATNTGHDTTPPSANDSDSDSNASSIPASPDASDRNANDTTSNDSSATAPNNDATANPPAASPHTP